MEAAAKYETPGEQKYEVALAQARKDNCNILLPSQRLGALLSDFHHPVLDYVELSQEPDQGDVYVQEKGNQKKPTKYAVTKRGLQKLAMCAGVMWDYANTHRTDDRRDPNYVSFQAVGGVKTATGEIWFKADYDLDFEVILDELEELYRGKAEYYEKDDTKEGQWWHKFSEDQKEGWIQKCIRRDLLQKRKHKLKLCETGAMNRVIRALLNMKATYSRDELKKPFVVARITVQPDWSDPKVREEMNRESLKSILGVYGPGKYAFQGSTVIPQPSGEKQTVIEIPDDDGDMPLDSDPEPPPPEEPVTIPTGKEEPQEDPIEAQIRGYREANRADQIQAIDALIDRKGYDRKLLKKPLDKHGERALEDFFLYLVNRPDKEPEIPFPK